MRRWHDARELRVMLKRWRLELREHGYPWGDYVGPYLAGAEICVRSCHCEKGPGHYRKKTPLGHHHACKMCAWDKWVGRGPDEKFRTTREFEALRAERAADEPVRYRRKKRLMPAQVKHELFMMEIRGWRENGWKAPRAFIEAIRREVIQEVRRKKKVA